MRFLFGLLLPLLLLAPSSAALEADVAVTVLPVTDRIDPGQVGEFQVQVCNRLRGELPPTVRVELSSPNGFVRSVVPAAGFTCTAEGPKVVCTIAELAAACPGPAFRVRVQSSHDRMAGEVKLTARAFGDQPEPDHSNDQDTRGVPVYRWIAVTNVADAGPGSLRDAIERANARCSPGPCRIVFEIPGPVPPEGWFTITPSEPLPELTADRVTVEGSWQTSVTGNTNPRGPEVAIDGRLAGRGLKVLTRCEGVVEGLAIGNFAEDQGLWFATSGDCGGRPDKREVTLSHIGMDPSGFIAWPNRRGLRLDIASGVLVWRNVIAANRYAGVWMWAGAATIFSNYIADNGASGVFLGPSVNGATVTDNVIRNHPHMGVAAARGARAVLIRRNRMRNNDGLGIDWALDGVSPGDRNGAPDAPVVLSALYDLWRNETTITVKGPATETDGVGTLDLFADAGPNGDGEDWLIEAKELLAGETHVLVVRALDLSGKWITATWTSTNRAMTSELGNSVPVQ